MQPLPLARVCALVGLAALALPGPAQAQERHAGPAQAQERPAGQPSDDALPASLGPPSGRPQFTVQHRWHRAAELFAEGARLFKQWRFEEAEAKYRDALAHMEHPVIRLYLSRALEKQGRLLEAHEALQQARRRGIASLRPGDVPVAEKLQQSLESRLAQIEVQCDVPGAEIFLDGEHWFTAPGRQRRMVDASQHVLSARKPGYFPVTEAVSLFPGRPTQAVLRMTADVVHVERRWPRWQPRAVVGTGIAVSVVGGLLLSRARSEYAAIQSEFDTCERFGSCERLPRSRLDGVVWTERIGTGALITGGTIVAAGLAGVLLNVPRTWRSEPGGGVEILEIAPALSPDLTGISARFRF